MYVNVYTFEQDSGWKSRHITCWIVHPSITSSTGPAGSTSISKAPSMVTALVVRLSCEEKVEAIGDRRGTTLPTNHFQWANHEVYWSILSKLKRLRNRTMEDDGRQPPSKARAFVEVFALDINDINHHPFVHPFFPRIPYWHHIIPRVQEARLRRWHPRWLCRPETPPASIFTLPQPPFSELSHGFPMVFPWFSHNFPMVFPWFSRELL